MPNNYSMTNLLVIPSLDIKDNKLVRIVQGIPKIAEMDYPDDPIEMAKIWRAENARCIQVIDVDGAWNSSVDNSETIAKLVQSVVIPVQLGGGLRSIEKIDQAFEVGVSRIILGTICVNDENIVKYALEKYGHEKIIIAIDAYDDKVYIEGRKKETEFTPYELILKMKELGAKRFLFTDIKKNGMLTHPDFEFIKDLVIKTGIKLTVSGGVRDLDDLLKLKELKPIGVDSVIIGRALYENCFACQKLWRLAENKSFLK